MKKRPTKLYLLVRVVPGLDDEILCVSRSRKRLRGVAKAAARGLGVRGRRVRFGDDWRLPGGMELHIVIRTDERSITRLWDCEANQPRAEAYR